MEIQSAFNSGIQGFNKATETANQAAADIVASTTFDEQDFSTDTETGGSETQTASAEQRPNLNQSIVELKVAEHQAKASAKVIKSADENLGTLLDVSV
ncbi:flagellar hook protein FlgE [Thalassotalea insulae]|uniref:Flagellar hook protein FlgE n=1 Tax=Thalassotalea insulae TaxID=2056778 RepID=A0ABQ6GSW6_9GAMM|nr:hypothetical protein [Thalassotalea insulae]GLX78719.1 flagellar hook protein FlgE [Thalassotalea insulae]